jgi:hypothetical protein
MKRFLLSDSFLFAIGDGFAQCRTRTRLPHHRVASRNKFPDCLSSGT